MMLLKSLMTTIALSCAEYYRVEESICAQTCLNSTVGKFCPVAIVAKAGKLTVGSCADVGYKVANGSTSHKAGPCGTLTFAMFTKATDLELVDDTNVTIHKLNYPQAGDCGQFDMPSKEAHFPVTFGGFKNGNCATDGFTIADGTKHECSPKVAGKQWCADFLLFAKNSSSV